MVSATPVRTTRGTHQIWGAGRADSDTSTFISEGSQREKHKQRSDSLSQLRCGRGSRSSRLFFPHNVALDKTFALEIWQVEAPLSAVTERCCGRVCPIITASSRSFTVPTKNHSLHIALFSQSKHRECPGPMLQSRKYTGEINCPVV